MNVLSLFDGISAGQVALERAAIKIDNYYASEIDNYAIKVTQKNYPGTVQLGDIELWKDWDIEIPDIIIAGSPCQGFSIAGKQLNFEDPRSKLFFTFVEILRHYQKLNPNIKFLLENVRMKKQWKDLITEFMGVEPVEIDSALVSAQSRKRLYWTNIENIEQPKDKEIYLKDIIEHGFVDRDKSYCIDANYFKGGNLRSYYEDGRRQIVNLSSSLNHKRCIQVGEADLSGHDICRRVYSLNGKSPAIKTGSGGNLEPKIITSEKTYRKLTPLECERLQTFPDKYTEGVSNTRRYHGLGNSWTVDVIVHIFKNLKT